MADTNPELETLKAQPSNTQPEDQEATRLASLRTLAQQHLEEIGEMAKKDQVQEARRMKDLEDESRRKEARKSRHTPGMSPVDDADGESDEKKPRMRTAQDVLERLRWDPSLKIEEHRVGYIDRFGGIQELPVSQWTRESTDEEWIPQHRIRYFKRTYLVNAAAGVEKSQEDIVWHRDERVDRVFGSRQ